MAIVKGRKNLLLILLIRLKKANISVDMLYDEKDADFVFHCFVANFLNNIVVLDTNAFQVFSRDIIYFSTSFSSEYHSKPANQTSRNRN